MKTRPEIAINFRSNDGALVSVPLDTLIEKLGIGIPVDEITMTMEQDCNRIELAVEPAETEYPGVFIDAIDRNGKTMCIAYAELPNETFPDQITARLYAGYQEHEYDGPIALVKHRIEDPARIKELEALAESGRGLTKLVYVDTEAAAWRPWRGDDGPEHNED